jgi:signal transduction histidine kinase
MMAPAEKITPQAVRDNYEQLITQLRQTINGLRSPMLNYGLHAALEDLLDSMMDNPQFGSKFTMDVPASLARFDPNVEMHLFRIIQQACDNALQHAQAQHIRVYGKIEAGCINLTVEDDGIGFQLGTETDLAYVLSKKHFGLVSMLERGKLTGAEVQIISHPGAGTLIRVLWEPQKIEFTGEIV